MTRNHILCFALLIISGALLFSAPSCRKTPAPSPPPVVTDTTQLVQEVKDSLTVKVKSSRKFLTLDLLVYGGAPLLRLESCHRTGADSLFIELKDSLPKKLVVLGNMPGELNTAAIQHYDSLQGLEMSLWDDNPEYPFLSGLAEHKGGSGRVELEIRALMSCVLVRSITNLGDDYTLLENLSFRLSGMNARASLMSWNKFSCTEPVEGPVSKAPYDVGIYTQYPELRLWCYPSNTSPKLIVEYSKRDPKGELGALQVALETGPIGRDMELTMDVSLK